MQCSAHAFVVGLTMAWAEPQLGKLDDDTACAVQGSVATVGGLPETPRGPVKLDGVGVGALT